MTSRRARWRWLVAAVVFAGACAGANRPPQLEGGGDLQYPAEARAAGVEGRVLVRYDITAQGRVANAVVVAATPKGVFEAAALAAVYTWRFRPALAGGKPVGAPRRESEVVFRLGEEPRYANLPRP